MPIYVRTSGTWNAVQNVYVRQGGVWDAVPQAYVRVAGTYYPLLGDNLLSATYTNKSFTASVGGGLAFRAVGLVFNPTGTNLYAVSADPDVSAVRVYTLTTPWDLDTTVTGSHNFIQIIGGMTSLAMRPNGSQYYMVAAGATDFYRGIMTTSWDPDTASYDSSYSGTGRQYQRITMKPDGSRMYATSAANPGVIYILTLSTPWNLSTISETGSVALGISNPRFIQFKSDGRYFYYGLGNSVYQYYLSTPWDLTTRVEVGALPPPAGFSVDVTAGGLAFSDDESQFYVLYDLFGDFVGAQFAF